MYTLVCKSYNQITEDKDTVKFNYSTRENAIQLGLKNALDEYLKVNKINKEDFRDANGKDYDKVLQYGTCRVQMSPYDPDIKSIYMIMRIEEKNFYLDKPASGLSKLVKMDEFKYEELFENEEDDDFDDVGDNKYV